MISLNQFKSLHQTKISFSWIQRRTELIQIIGRRLLLVPSIGSVVMVIRVKAQSACATTMHAIPPSELQFPHTGESCVLIRIGYRSR